MDAPPTQDAVASTRVTWKLPDHITNTVENISKANETQLADHEDVDKINNNNISNEHPTVKDHLKEDAVNENLTKMPRMDYSQECSKCTSDNTSDPSQFATKAKEILTSFSRSISSDLYQQPFNVKVDTKLGDIFDRLSSWTDDSLTGFSLPSFIVAGIASNLKLLGVEEIDCKEHVEAWLSQRRQRRWKQSLGRQALNILRKECTADSYSCTQCFQKLGGGRNSATELSSSITNDEKSETLTVFNPSQPNSSLLRLTGDGDVKLGQFLQKTEEVRGHFNNASCTLLQSTVVLTLPYLKLLSGNHLDDVCCRNFTEEWIFVVTMMAQELKSASMKEVDMMLCREYRSLRTDSEKLYKRLGKLYRKVSKIYEENERDTKPALQRLQPKKLPRFRGRPAEKAAADKEKEPTGINTTIEERPVAPTIVLELSPVPLGRANIATADLYKDHVFFTKSKKGHLVFKNSIEGEWRRFSELSFNSRRELFLHVVEDLHNTLKLGANICGHVKELFLEGYPESVCTKIQENLRYLRQVSKDDDLLMLSKVTIANQVKSLHESLARLVQALKNLKSIAKWFYTTIKVSSYANSHGGALWSWKSTKVNSTESSSLARDKWTREFDVNLSLRFDNSRVKLMVPYPNSMNPFLDQFCMSSMQ